MRSIVGRALGNMLREGGQLPVGRDLGTKERRGPTLIPPLAMPPNTLKPRGFPRLMETLCCHNGNEPPPRADSNGS
jgi:hypothetical protein